MNSDRCKLDVNKLSSESRDTFDHTSHNALYICQMCINRHEGHEDSSTNFDEPAQDTSLDTSFDTFVDFGSSEPAESYVSVSAEHIFEEKNKSMKSLIVLCCGLKNSDGTNLIDIDDDPWKSLPVATTKPNAADYKVEVTRRYHLLNLSGVGVKDPRPKQWTLSRLLEWLKLHPLRDASDVQFLQETVKNRKVVAERVVAQRANDKVVHDKAEKNWYGPKYEKYDFQPLVRVGYQGMEKRYETMILIFLPIASGHNLSQTSNPNATPKNSHFVSFLSLFQWQNKMPITIARHTP